MAIKAAELQVVIGADTNPAVQGIRGAMGTIGNVASTALGVFSGMLMTQAVGALGGLASAGIQAVGEFERMGATLSTLVKRDLMNTGGSLDQVAEKTKSLMNWVQQLAKESPFDASGVTVALRTAMAYGFTAEQAQRLTKATIDFAAGSGQNADVMNQIALALGQIQAKGKLAGQEMLQLTNAGIDVRDALSKYLGKSIEDVSKMIEKGAIDANTAIEAITTALEKDFGGAAKEQSLTVSGLLSTFEELKQMGLRELFTGIVEAVRPLAGSFLDWLQEDGIARARALGQTIGELTTRAIEFAQTNIAPVIQQVFGWIRDNGETVRGALMVIAIAFGAMAVVSTVTGMIAMLTNPLTLLIALAGLLGAAWVNNWGGIQEKTAAVWTWLQGAFAQISAWLTANLPVALTTLQQIWQNIWIAMQTWFAAALPVFTGIFNAFRAAFEGDWTAFGSYLRDAWDAAWENTKKITQKALDWFKSQDWGEIGRNIIQGIANGIKSAVSWLIDAAESAAKAAVDAAKGFLKIKSPSQVFEQQVGANLMAGWVRGIERMTPRLEAAVVGASGRAVMAATTNNYYNLTVQSLRSAEQIERDFWLMRG